MKKTIFSVFVAVGFGVCALMMTGCDERDDSAGNSAAATATSADTGAGNSTQTSASNSAAATATSDQNTEQTSASNTTAPKQKQKQRVEFVLDFVPNTNHTGLFVALDKGYFDEIGIDFVILSAPEDSTSDLVITGKVPFGIYFQESMGAKLSRGARISAVAAIIEHNTSGILSTKPLADLANAGKALRYGSWNDPVELAMMRGIFAKLGITDYKLIPNTDANSIASLANGVFDACWVYYAWDGVLAGGAVETSWVYMSQIEPALDYYSPIIIANDEYLRRHKSQARDIVQAIKRGYIYAINHPDEAANILIKHAPELAAKRDKIILSQRYLASQYASEPSKWGLIDGDRWDGFYEWLNAQGVLARKVPLGVGYTNEFVK